MGTTIGTGIGTGITGMGTGMGTGMSPQSGVPRVLLESAPTAQTSIGTVRCAVPKSDIHCEIHAGGCQKSCFDSFWLLPSNNIIGRKNFSTFNPAAAETTIVWLSLHIPGQVLKEI